MQIKEHFGQIPDPRKPQGKLHSLSDIIGLTLIAGLCGIKSFEDVAWFGEIKQVELKEVLELKNGIPSHDTFERVFSIIKPKEFNNCFIRWTERLCSTHNDLIVLDGKISRNAYSGKDPQEALYLVNAWASNNKLVLAQYKTKGKGHEIAGIKEMLKLLCIQGATVSIDAIGCQKDIVEKIVEQGGDYIIAVKDNQPTLKNDIVSSFTIQSTVDSQRTQKKKSGRIETRMCSVITNLKNITHCENWNKLTSIIKIESTRIVNNKEQQQIRYYISSLSVSAEQFNLLIRAHWSIENSLHWVLDVIFNEDKSRKRKGYIAENYSLISKMVLNILRKDTATKIPLKRKQLKATMDFDYLKSLLSFLA